MGHRTHVVLDLYTVGTVVSATDQNSSAVACGNYNEAVIYIEVTAKAGTTPTIDFDVQTSPDQSSWHKHTDITQINDPTVTHYADAVKLTQLGEFLRLNPTVGGSGGPSMTLRARVELKT